MSPEATEMPEATTTRDARSVVWPGEDPGTDADAGSATTADSASARGTAAPKSSAKTSSAPSSTASAASSAKPRRDNPLVAGLVRAMRDAATAARKDAATRFAEQAKSGVEALNAKSVDEIAQLRRQADADVGEIRDWSKAEMAHIREETDSRISGRRHRLEGELEAQSARVEERVEYVKAAIAEYERRMDTFFDELLDEEDPARLASLAEQLPEPPELDIEDLEDLAPAARTAVLDARGAAAAEAEAFADLDESTSDADAGSSATESDDAPVDEAVVARRLEAFTGPAVVEASASRLAVVGLVSVASIAGFKRALAKASGVRSVTVSSGPNGDFIFTVAHEPETDLGAAVTGLEGFAAVVTGDADGVITITATDPERTQ